MKTILLIEPNPYHGEVLPGIVKYLEDLQYTVDVYMQNCLLGDNAFCRYPRPVNIRGYEFSDIQNILGSENIKEYDFVFFSSMEFAPGDGVFNIIQHLGFIPQAKHGILGIYHSTSLLDTFCDHELMAQGRFFCFSDFQKHHYTLKTLTPIYFGETVQHPQQFIQPATIACVGGAFSGKLLVDALWKTRGKLSPKQLKINLYGARYSLSLIKRIKLFVKMFVSSKKKVPYAYRFITTRGYVPFSILFDEIAQSSYILVLIDPADKSHEHYLSYTTSGVKALIHGFNKVPIIHRNVATQYGFDETNSVLFDDDNCSANATLANILVQIANGTDLASGKSEALKQLSESIYKTCLANLRKTIEGINEYK
jgi:hypothetical protein